MVTTQSNSPIIEWSPVIAGSLVACAISVVLTQFGQGLGLSFTHLQSDDAVTVGSLIALGLWLLWTQLSASMAGGYLAGRMLGSWGANHESELRDGAHGLLVWALSTVATALFVGAAAAIAALATPHGVDTKHVAEMSDEMIKKMGIISGFALAATSVVSAAAAYIAATFGGDHRDRKVDVRKQTSFRRTVRAQQ